MKSLYFILFCIFIISCTTSPKPSQEPISCPTDAKECPDGSVLARIAPDCIFPECPELTEDDKKTPDGERKKTFCIEEQRFVDACTEIYQPVCGWFNPEISCVTFPCASTYSNPCFACKEKIVSYWTDGNCPSPS